MKRVMLVENELMQSDITNAIKIYGSMEQSEKDGWITRIQKCIEKLGYGRVSTADIVTGGFGVGLIIAGIKLNIPLLCVMGAVTITALAHFDKDVWIKIIECAKNKPKTGNVGTTTNAGMTTPEQTIQETKMKKIIRLTESELVELVRNIIKEDEMGVETSLAPTLTVAKILNEFDTLNEGMMVSVKNNVLTIRFPDEAKYLVRLEGKKQPDMSEVQTNIVKKQGKLFVGKGGNVIVLEPYFKVTKQGF